MMRIISDLFSRGESAESIAREDLEGGGAEMIEFRIKGGVEQIELVPEFYRRIEFPRTMRDGNLAHFSGTSEDEIVFSSIWDTEANARAAYAELCPEIAQLNSEFGTGTSVERLSSGVHRFSIGDEVSEFSHERASLNPSCVGYVIDIPLHGKMAYDIVCKSMHFPEEFPPGLVMHVAGQTDRGWRTFSIWHDVRHSLDFFEQRLMPAAVDMVRERGMFPEIRPVEVKPTLFALNARMLG